eukprot:5379722-Pyramimonas_sp.AAC.1
MGAGEPQAGEELTLALGPGQSTSRHGARPGPKKGAPQHSGDRWGDMEAALADANPQSVAPPKQPSHKKCSLCIFYDDDEGPVEKAMGRSPCMFWGKPRGPNGETNGN